MSTHRLIKKNPDHTGREDVATLRSLAKRIGIYSVFALLMGTTAILGSLDFITFLWFGGDKSYPYGRPMPPGPYDDLLSGPDIWRHIMVSEWASRSVTLASLLIRTSIAAQALVCTAMLAALSLQWRQVQLSDAAPLSLLRYSNSGPTSLILPLWGSRRSLKPMTSLLVILLTSTTLVSNITSTALLSDLRQTMLPGNEKNTRVLFGQSYPLTMGVGISDYWVSRPTQYPSFAEEGLRNQPWPAPGMHEIGPFARTMIPISPVEDRSNVFLYSGPVKSLSMTSRCIKPRLQISDKSFTRTANDFTYEISGTVFLDLDEETMSVFELQDDKLNSSGRNFQCAFSGRWTDIPKQGYVTLCNIPSIINGTVDLGNYTVGPQRYASARDILFLHMTPSGFNKSPENLSEWTFFEDTVAEENSAIIWRATVCSNSGVERFKRLIVQRSNNVTEPIIMLNTSTQRWSTDLIRKQLDSSRIDYTLGERGLLHVTGYPQGRLPLSPEQEKIQPTTWSYGALSSEELNYRLHICSYCNLSGDHIESSQAALFMDILEESDHPALAIQAITMLHATMEYYNSLVTADLEDSTAIVRPFVLTLRPVLGWGYWTVTAILASHLAVVLTIVSLYIHASEKTALLGHAWGVVSQLRSEDTDFIFEDGACRTDKEVKEMLKKKSLEEERVVLATDDDGTYRIRMCTGSCDDASTARSRGST